MKIPIRQKNHRRASLKNALPSYRSTSFDHGIPKNPYNIHAWILGKPKIDSGTWIGAFTLVDAKHAKVTIGKGCNISSGAQIVSHSTVRRCLSEGKYNQVDAKDIVIEDYCFIGTNAVILMGAHIGHHSVIAAGCVVPENAAIPPYSLVAGVPGKITGSSKKFLSKKQKQRGRGGMPFRAPSRPWRKNDDRET